MPFGSEFTEKLTHTLVATALCRGSVAIASSLSAGAPCYWNAREGARRWTGRAGKPLGGAR
jgi:hypothetical protein